MRRMRALTHFHYCLYLYKVNNCSEVLVMHLLCCEYSRRGSVRRQKLMGCSMGNLREPFPDYSWETALVPRLSSAQVKVLHKVLLVALPLHRLGSWVESHQYIHHLSWKLATLLPSPRGSVPCEHSRLTVACCYFHCSEGLQPFPALDLLLGTSTVLTGRFLAALLDLLERETQPPT